MDPRHELADMLLRKAQDDLVMARRLADDPATPEWGVGFHVQQAVEKALKSVLCAKGVEYPRTHSIAALLNLLGVTASEIPVDRAALILLTPYGALLRYDEAGPTEAEMAQLPARAALLAVAAKVVEWAGQAARR